MKIASNENDNQGRQASVQLTLFDMECEKKGERKYIRQVEYDEIKQFLFNIHYARRMPSVSYAFGLIVDMNLIGIVTYGVPASHSLCIGVAGEKNQNNVLELNRLCLLPEFNGGNYASYLVSHSLKKLPNGTFVVSYADTAWGHVGYVYQATNFLYTGMSAKRTDVFVPNGMHGRHGHEKYKHLMYRQTRSAKHRYIYLVGDRRTRKKMLKDLKYPVIKKYPKGDEKYYDVDNPKPVNPIKIYKTKTS